jgi:hypothetical protein
MTAGNSKTSSQDALIRGPLLACLRLRKETVLADSPLLSGPLQQASQGSTTVTATLSYLTSLANASSRRSKPGMKSTVEV